MQQKDYYNTITENAVAEFKDKGSRFIAYAYPLQGKDAFKNILALLKKEHPKAVHHCFAYRIGTDGNNFRSSDDGEPSGSAGKPILGQIDSRQLTNIAIVVVRYFGGTLLGVPGLIHAYKTAAALCLQTVPIVQKTVTSLWQISFDYTQMNEVMRRIKSCNCEIEEQEMQLFCKLVVHVPNNRLHELKMFMADMKGVEMGSMNNRH